MATIKVSDQAQFLSALKTATGGDTILLADGHYGDLDLKNDYSSAVTIQAENPLGATFTRLGLVGATNITLDGIQFETGLAVKEGSKGISVLNSDVNGMIYTRSVDGLVIDNVDVSGGRYGILLNSVKNFSITNSYIHEVGEDLMRITGASSNGLIENNVIFDTIAASGVHPDIIQFFHVDGVTPRDITIRGNVLADNPTTGAAAAQGLFISDPGRGDANKGYENILIEDNLIKTSASNTLFLNSAHSSVEVLNNTLVASAGGGNIRLVGEVFEDGGPVIDGNVFKGLINETGSVTLLDNYIYGKSVSMRSLFQGTDGSKWHSYLPVEGSAIDFGTGYGALDRLKALLLEYGYPVPETTSTPAPSSEPDGTVTTGPQAVYSLDNAYEITGTKSSSISLTHDSALEIDTGTIGLTFNADTVSNSRGILSKGAAGYDDDLSIWIQNGKLVVAFENDQGQSGSISYNGIKTDTDYKLLVTFDEENVQLWLNGTMVGEKTFDLDLSGNDEYLVLGGINGQSARGTTSRVASFFDGTISNVVFYDDVLTPTEFSTLETLRHEHDLALTY